MISANSNWELIQEIGLDLILNLKKKIKVGDLNIYELINSQQGNSNLV